MLQSELIAELEKDIRLLRQENLNLKNFALQQLKEISDIKHKAAQVRELTARLTVCSP